MRAETVGVCPSAGLKLKLRVCRRSRPLSNGIDSDVRWIRLSLKSRCSILGMAAIAWGTRLSSLPVRLNVRRLGKLCRNVFNPALAPTLSISRAPT
ncbi:hypothetical protein D3C84_1001950 [compost metagenome]